ncbi:MAG: hypothetical protein ACLPV8_18200 [Steroidobacteraceae bacterium]
MPTPIRNDFKKAMTSIVLTAGAALADAERTIDKAGGFRRKQAQQELKLATEFCRLLLEPVSPSISGFAEIYCRKHLAVATQFLTNALATHDSHLPEYKRLVRIAGQIEENLKANLDPEAAKLCWFGDDDDTVIRELEKHSFG